MVRLPEKGSDDGQGKDNERTESPSLADLSAEVKELVRLISTTDVTELQLESGQVRIIIKRGGHAHTDSHPRPTVSYVPAATAPEPAAPKPVTTLFGQNPAHGEELTL